MCTVGVHERYEGEMEKKRGQKGEGERGKRELRDVKRERQNWMVCGKRV